MTFNMTLFICLFYLAIIVMKVECRKEKIDRQKSIGKIPQGSVDDLNTVTEVLQVQQEFIKNPKRQPDYNIQNIMNGNAKISLSEAFVNSMGSENAQQCFHNVESQWQLLIGGPFAKQVIGNFGKNFRKVASSSESAKLLNLIESVLYMLLTKAGEKKQGPGIINVLNKSINLFKLPQMPEIVNNISQLVLRASKKENAHEFTQQFWQELKQFLETENLNKKLESSFKNIETLMEARHKKIISNKSKKR